MAKKTDNGVNFYSVSNTFKMVVAPKNEEQKEMMKTIAKNKITFVKGAPGTGKCITPDSFISTNSGLIKFSDIVSNVKKDNYKCYKTTIVNRYGEFEETSHIYNSGVQKTIKVTSKCGYSIEGTPNHRVLCLTSRGIEWKELSQITKNDYLCINRNQHIDENNKSTDDIAYFIGLLIGDGCYDLKNTFSFRNIDTSLVGFFKRFCVKHFNCTPQQSKTRPCDYVVCSRSARQYLYDLGLRNVKEKDKEIPPSFLDAGQATYCSILRGLFDTCGIVKKSGQLCFVGKSTKLCQQIHQMLLRIGIVSQFSTVVKKYKNKEKEYGKISVIDSSLNRFNEMIGFNVDYKQQKLNTILNNQRNIKDDTIPTIYAKPLLTRYWGQLSSKDKNRKSHKLFYHYITNTQKHLRSISYDKMRFIYNLYKDKYPNKDIEQILTLDYFFDNIADIDHSENQVYDFVVPKTHSFVANGIVNHNTFLAVTFALQQLLRNKCKKIVFTRPIVEAAGEKLGFLPGDMYEKINPYMIPIFDSLLELIPSEIMNKLMTKNGKEAAIRALPLAFMRGITFKHSFVICDEMQNSTRDQMRMLLTRTGEGTKMIVCGDVEQSDIHTKDGLRDAFDILQGIEGIGFVTLSENAVVRDPIVREIDKRYAEHNNNNKEREDNNEN